MHPHDDVDGGHDEELPWRVIDPPRNSTGRKLKLPVQFLPSAFIHYLLDNGRKKEQDHHYCSRFLIILSIEV